MYNIGQEYLIRIGRDLRKCTLTHILGDEGCCSMILVDGFKLEVMTQDLLDPHMFPDFYQSTLELWS